MRIAMITDSYHPTKDGVVTSLDITKGVLESIGHEVSVIAPDPGEKDRIPGVHYFPAIGFKWYEGYFLPVLPSNKIEILRRIDPDVIHVHGIAFMAVKALIAARTLKKPIVMTFHTMVGDTMKYYSPVKMPEELSERLVWIYLRNILKRVDALILPTAPIADELAGKGVNTKNMTVIPTGIDTLRFVPGSGAKIRERYGIKDKKVVIHVGRISFEKNIHIAVEAMGSVDGAVLMIVGKGPAEDSIRKTVAENGLCDRVIFTGFVGDDELTDHYNAADAAVSASEFETQGLSVLEAMSCGLPVACVGVRAFAEFVRDGYNGHLFDGTPEGCANALKLCLSADDDMRKNARSTAESFSLDKVAVKLTELYEAAISDKKNVC